MTDNALKAQYKLFHFQNKFCEYKLIFLINQVRNYRMISFLKRLSLEHLVFRDLVCSAETKDLKF